MQALVHPSVVSYSHDYPYNHMYVVTLYIQLLYYIYLHFVQMLILTQHSHRTP